MSFQRAFGSPAAERSEDGSSLTVWRPHAGVVLSEVTGVYTSELCDELLRHLDEAVVEAPKVLACHDWLEVERFDVEVQRKLTEWTVRHLKESQKTHVGVRSPIIRMSVTVANVPLKGLIGLHDSADTLVPAVEASIRKHLAEIG